MSFRGALLIGVCLVALMPAASAVGRGSHEGVGVGQGRLHAGCDAVCRDAMPNVRSVLVCFSRNRDKISGRCNAVLASYGL